MLYKEALPVRVKEWQDLFVFFVYLQVNKKLSSFPLCNICTFTLFTEKVSGPKVWVIRVRFSSVLLV